jgi:hypothetical protein
MHGSAQIGTVQHPLSWTDGVGSEGCGPDEIYQLLHTLTWTIGGRLGGPCELRFLLDCCLFR